LPKAACFPLQYGLPFTAAELSPDEAATLLEAYQADKSWRAKGAARATAPQDIRAGRLVIELHEKDVGAATPALAGPAGLRTLLACAPCWPAPPASPRQQPAPTSPPHPTPTPILCRLQAPKAAENFRCLATGEKGLGKGSKKPLHYKVGALQRQPDPCPCWTAGG
jgi:hypothetical protein